MKTMKTVTAIIGSPKERNSYTYDMVCKLMDEIDSTGVKYNKVLIPLSEYTVNPCKGCARCFLECRVCHRFDDDLKYIENQILMSDVVIFASPVYAHNVTGVMKNFIDRISYGLHVLRYAGKYGVTISVSDSNGNGFVDDYLNKILVYLGVKVIDKVSIQMVKGIDEDALTLCAKKIVDILQGNGGRKAFEYENMVFNVMKNALTNVKSHTETKETQYWTEHGYFECRNFEELFAKEYVKLDNNI